MVTRKNESYKMNTALLSRAVATQTVTHDTVVLSLGATESKPAVLTVLRECEAGETQRIGVQVTKADFSSMCTKAMTDLSGFVLRLLKGYPTINRNRDNSNNNGRKTPSANQLYSLFKSAEPVLDRYRRWKVMADGDNYT